MSSYLDRIKANRSQPATQFEKNERSPEPVVTDEEATARGWWTLADMVSYLARLSDTDLDSFRQALRFDVEALRRLDAQRAQGVTDDATA